MYYISLLVSFISESTAFLCCVQFCFSAEVTSYSCLTIRFFFLPDAKVMKNIPPRSVIIPAVLKTIDQATLDDLPNFSRRIPANCGDRKPDKLAMKFAIDIIIDAN